MSSTRTTPALEETKAVLATVVQIVVFLFAAFGSHLADVAPPLSRVGGLEPRFAAGVASFAALLVFLLAKAWIHDVRKIERRRTWARVSTALTAAYIIAALLYAWYLSAHTFRISADVPDARVEIAGTERTDSGDRLRTAFGKAEGREPLDVELLQFAGNDPARIPTIWTPESILDVQIWLITLYVAMVLLLAGAIAGLIELLLARAPTTNGRTDRAAPATARRFHSPASLRVRRSALMVCPLQGSRCRQLQAMARI